MNKKIVAVLIIALLAVSFAAARVVNLQIGPSISFFKGQAPVEIGKTQRTPYQGFAFGLDTAVDLTFGPNVELYFQDTLNIARKDVFKDFESSKFIQKEFDDKFTIDYKTHAGFEYAVVLDPVKVSVGGGLAFEVIATNFRYKEDETKGIILLDLNMGLGATVKVEYPFANHWSAYARAFVDYFPAAGLAIGYYPNDEGEEPHTAKGRVNNFSVDASAGIVFYF